MSFTLFGIQPGSSGEGVREEMYIFLHGFEHSIELQSLGAELFHLRLTFFMNCFIDLKTVPTYTYEYIHYLCYYTGVPPESPTRSLT